MRKVLLIILLIISNVATAIVPVEKLISVPAGVSGTIGLALEGEEGNRREQEYNINGIIRYGWGTSNSLMWITDYNYTKTDGRRNEDDLSTHLRFIRNDYVRKNVDIEAFIQYEYDDFADLSSRQLAGGGLRWRFENIGEKTTFRTQLGAGAFYEAEESQRTTASDETVRANFYAKLRYTNSDERAFEYYVSAYLQPSLEALNNVRSLLVSGIEFPISDALSLSVEAQVGHNSEPFAGVKKTNLEYGVKLSFSF